MSDEKRSRIMAVENYHLWLLIVMAVLVKTTGAQGVTPADVTVYKREQVTLNCSGSTVSWFRVEGGVTKKLFTSPNEWHAQNSNKYDIIGNYYLVINDAQPSSDGGTYQCNTDENQSQLFNADVVVLDDLSVKVSPEVDHDLGMTIVIRCTARYGGPSEIDSGQDPTLTLMLDNAQPTGQIYYEAPGGTDNIHTKTLEVNYTLSETTPGRDLRCRVTSSSYQKDVEKRLDIKSAPLIEQITEMQYNKSDTITCRAEGTPLPTVTWTYISGSMPETMSGLSGPGQAVLRNLEEGEQAWMCTATNDFGSTSINVTFIVSGVVPGPSTGSASKVGIAIGIAVGVGVPLIIAVIVIVCILMRRKKHSPGGARPVDPPIHPINTEHRPPRPKSGDPNVNVNPNPTYPTPVYPEQYGGSPEKTSPNNAGFGDLGVRPIHAGGSTPSLNRSYEGSPRESGADNQFQGPNTSV